MLALKADGSGEPPALSRLSGSPRRTPNTSPTESLTRRGAPPLQVGRCCSVTGTAADSGKVTPLYYFPIAVPNTRQLLNSLLVSQQSVQQVSG